MRTDPLTYEKLISRGQSINWKMIEAHLPSMLSLAVSIKTGKITPPAILRCLGTQNRKNKLYSAFRKLGMAVRTMFLRSKGALRTVELELCLARPRHAH